MQTVRLSFIRPHLSLRLALVIIGMATVLSGCGTAKVASQHAITPAPPTKPAIVYVADFDLDTNGMKGKSGILPALPKPPGPMGNGLPLHLPPLPRASKDPQTRARELVDSMSASIVRDLAKAGLNARRLSAKETPPNTGWLVRGAFTTVNQGDQLQRAAIGFGAGKTDLQVLVDIADLSQDCPKRFHELTTTADSGKAPGAGPMMVLCPAGAAARFVLAGQDLDRNVKQTASKIAGEITKRMNEER